MAVIFSKLGGHNDPLYKPVNGVLTTIISDMDSKDTSDDAVLKAMFNVKKSKKHAEGVSGMTEFANFDIIGEGQSAIADELEAGFSKIIQHITFAKSFTTTREMIEDSRIDEAKIAAENFVKAYKRTQLEFATLALTSQASTFVYSGKTVDRTTGDAKALFATDHPGVRKGVSTQSNVFTNALGTDITAINTLANIGRNFKNDSGHIAGYVFDTIIIPGNRPAMEETVNRICATSLVVGSANNDINTQKGKWRVVVNHRWEAATGTDPYILMSSEANNAYIGSVFYNRIPLTVHNEVSLLTQNLVWSGRCRFSCGFLNWRHLILGGASEGTTLTLS